MLAAFTGGPLGSGRLAAVGPSAWQVSLVAILEMGVTAAVAAGAANWLLLRHTTGGWRSRRAPLARPGQTRPGGPSRGLPRPRAGR